MASKGAVMSAKDLKKKSAKARKRAAVETKKWRKKDRKDRKDLKAYDLSQKSKWLKKTMKKLMVKAADEDNLLDSRVEYNLDLPYIGSGRGKSFFKKWVDALCALLKKDGFKKVRSKVWTEEHYGSREQYSFIGDSWTTVEATVSFRWD